MKIDMTVRRAKAADAERVTEVFAAATADEAVLTWVMKDHPDIAQRWRTEHVPELIRHALHEDEVWVAAVGDDIRAVSLWRTVTDSEQGEQEVSWARKLFEHKPVPPFRRLAAVTAALAARHPEEFPHRYLQSIATLPRHRGSGAGGAILTHRLAAAVRAGVPVYLEASTERSAALYERCGFVRVGEPIPLPEDGPTMLPMWFRG